MDKSFCSPVAEVARLRAGSSMHGEEKSLRLVLLCLNHGCRPRVMFIVLELKQGVEICNPNTASLRILVTLYPQSHLCTCYIVSHVNVL